MKVTINCVTTGHQVIIQDTGPPLDQQVTLQIVETGKGASIGEVVHVVVDAATLRRAAAAFTG